MNGIEFARRRLRLPSLLALSATAALGGCASLGGNISGDFSCAAPDGICAPSSTIDDRALAMITADGSDGLVQPAASASRRTAAALRASTPASARRAAADAVRTREKVLRIVFQPYIDERGRLHEASAIRAVVASGEWQTATGQSSAVPGHLALEPAGAETFAEAVDRVDPPGGPALAGDADLPDPAAVAAARARKPDPVATIKAEVASRLAPKAGRAPAPATVDQVARPPSAAASPVLPPRAEVPASGNAGAAKAAGEARPGITPAGAQALERVKGNPSYQEIAGSVAPDARNASAASGAVPVLPVVSRPAVSAPGFPAGIEEGD